MTGICKEEKFSTESEVTTMALRHKITINVTDSHGKSTRGLKGAEMRLPARFARILFGEYTQVYHQAHGQIVDSVDIHKLKEGGTTHGQNEQTCAGTCGA